MIADFRFMIVPDFLTILLTVLVLAYLFLSGADWFAALGAVAFSVFLFLGIFALAKKIYKKDGLGFGDIKLMVPLSLFLSWPKTVMAVFLAFISGGFFAMLVLVSGKKKMGQALAFAPFLVLGFVLAFFFGEAIWNWYFALLI